LARQLSPALHSLHSLLGESTSICSFVHISAKQLFHSSTFSTSNFHSVHSISSASLSSSFSHCTPSPRRLELLLCISLRSSLSFTSNIPSRLVSSFTPFPVYPRRLDFLLFTLFVYFVHIFSRERFLSSSAARMLFFPGGSLVSRSTSQKVAFQHQHLK